MIFRTWRGLARTCGLLACAAASVAPGLAQNRSGSLYPPGAVVQPLAPDPSADLRRNLTALGSNAQSVSALVEAGRDALRIGDGQAALTFFSRAEELAPRDPRVKAGMASAMVHVGQPQAALGLFQEATALGAPEAELAADRGLARDLLGDPAGAQRDYAAALRRRNDPEVRRRMALSLAISGQRDAALAMIDGQVRENDRAGWRTHAFVLALTGDVAGATRAAQGVAPAGTADAMAPFLARLPALSPAQRAMAVHLGMFPPDGRVQYAGVANPVADPGALAMAGVNVASPPVAGPPSRFAATPEVERRSPRRRPGSSSPVERGAVSARTSEIEPRRQPERMLGPARIPGPNPREQVRVARAAPPPVEPRVTPGTPLRRFQPAPAEVRSQRAAVEPVEQRGFAVVETPPPADFEPPARSPVSQPGLDLAMSSGSAGAPIAQPGFSLTPRGPQASPTSPPFALSERRNSALGDIASVVNALPQEEAAGVASPPGQSAPPSRPARQPAPTPPAPARAPAAPARIWVQLATGGNGGDFTRMRSRAPALAGRQAWSTPLGSTNRLLVGPFATSREAQTLINQLRAQDISGLVWTSAAGQSIERLRIANDSRPASSRAEPARRPTGRADGATASARRTGARAATADRSPVRRGAGTAAERTPARRNGAAATSRTQTSGRSGTAATRSGSTRTPAAGAGGRSRPEPRTPPRRGGTR